MPCRQIVHDSQNQGQNKAISAVNRLKQINPTANYHAITEKLLPSNCLKIISNFDIVVDATDNFDARYILNDACVILKKVLVSGSAVGLEGQITVIKPGETPCYRCLYPSPSLMENCRSCANAGILGPVAGLIGCLEAIETLKLLSNTAPSSNKANMVHGIEGKQVFYDAKFGDFHSFELPSRNKNCIVCGDQPSIRTGEDIEQFITNIQCQSQEASDKYLGGPLPPDCEISCRDYLLQYENNESDESSSAFHIILDVRSSHQFSLTHLKLSNCVIVSDSSDLSRLPVPTQSDQKNSFNKILINLPLSILKSPGQLQQIKEYLVKVESSIFPLTDQKQDQKIRVFALCRRGIDSTVATRYLLENNINCQNISGGLTAWKETVDSNFPMY